MAELQVTQVKSAIGTKPKQRGTLRALGLGRSRGRSGELGARDARAALPPLLEARALGRSGELKTLAQRLHALLEVRALVLRLHASRRELLLVLRIAAPRGRELRWVRRELCARGGELRGQRVALR